MAVLVVGLLLSCTKDAKGSDGVSLTKYVPEDVKFLCSPDGGTWSTAIKQIPVGEVFYLKITVAIKGAMTEVPFSIKLPNTEVTQVTFTDTNGKDVNVNPVAAIDGSSIYDFKTIATPEAKATYVQFQCYPLKAGNQQYVVSYGKPVSSAYSNTRTLVYIEE
jgi:hypothetical protein